MPYYLVSYVFIDGKDNATQEMLGLRLEVWNF